jgi:hypothetical protein
VDTPTRRLINSTWSSTSLELLSLKTSFTSETSVSFTISLLFHANPRRIWRQSFLLLLKKPSTFLHAWSSLIPSKESPWRRLWSTPSSIRLGPWKPPRIRQKLSRLLKLLLSPPKFQLVAQRSSLNT